MRETVYPGGTLAVQVRVVVCLSDHFMLFSISEIQIIYDERIGIDAKNNLKINLRVLYFLIVSFARPTKQVDSKLQSSLYVTG